MANNNYELVVNKNVTYKVTNAKMLENIERCFNALRTIDKGQWEYAKSIHEINVNDYWRTDFDSLEKFLKEFGVAKTTYYRCNNAVVVMEQILIPNGYSYENITFTKAAILSTLGNACTQFVDSLKSSGIDLVEMGQTELAEKVKAYIKQLKGAVNGAKDEKDSEEKKEKNNDKPKAKISDDNIIIEYAGKTYSIPLKKLEKFEVVSSEEETEETEQE